MTPDREAMGLMLFSTEKAVRVSESLATLPQLNRGRAQMWWAAAWKSSVFIYWEICAFQQGN